ncbi:hypothetical protein [Salinicola aestuarinus]|uniref:hypothetical protein n=1 Tax=Salinicola aestuarinus TaxID=1949082 RepID=UPI001300363B|nr:hypothetical protein [Salinicola aestuarinus]
MIFDLFAHGSSLILSSAVFWPAGGARWVSPERLHPLAPAFAINAQVPRAGISRAVSPFALHCPAANVATVDAIGDRMVTEGERSLSPSSKCHEVVIKMPSHADESTVFLTGNDTFTLA